MWGPWRPTLDKSRRYPQHREVPAGGHTKAGVAFGLTRPAAWAALTVLVANDHWLKTAAVLPAWMTGKLSDFAGLFLAPLVLCALAAAALRIGHPARRWLPAASAMTVGMGFALIKLVPFVNGIVGRVWGPMALDATDLMALPMAALSAWFMSPSGDPPRSPGRPFRLASLAAALLACAATTPAPRECHPSWRLLDPSNELGCALLDGWVSKSGKEGFGLTLAITAADGAQTCVVRLTAATFLAGAFHSAPPALPAPVTVTGDEERYLYIPFPFDNQALWRESIAQADRRVGTVIVDVTAGEVHDRWTIRAEQQVRPRHERYGERYGGACDATPDRERGPRQTPEHDHSAGTRRDAREERE